MTDEREWIKWKGGECPVCKNDIVDICTRIDVYPQQRAGGWQDATWRHEPTYFYGNDSDIIAYRAVPV